MSKSEDMLGHAHKALNGVPEDALELVRIFANNLSGPKGTEWAKAGESFLNKGVGQGDLTITVQLLSPLKTIFVPATTEVFVAADHFKDGPTCNLGRRFKNLFSDKIEEPAGDVVIQSYKLLINGSIESIITALGGEDRVETTLSTFYSLREKQLSGELGDFFPRNDAVVFFVRDSRGVLGVVYLGADDDIEEIEAYTTKRSDHWPSGACFFIPAH